MSLSTILAFSRSLNGLTADQIGSLWAAKTCGPLRQIRFSNRASLQSASTAGCRPKELHRQTQRMNLLSVLQRSSPRQRLSRHHQIRFMSSDIIPSSDAEIEIERRPKRMRRLCYNCGLPGHVAADCRQRGDALAVGGDLATRDETAAAVIVCYNCGEEGHKARDCRLPPLRAEIAGVRRNNLAAPNEALEDFALPRGLTEQQEERVLAVFCYKCGKTGHASPDCPKQIMCSNCGQAGHISRECHDEERCLRCGKYGHMKFDCPDGKLCFKCGRPGHLSRFCDSSIRIN